MTTLRPSTASGPSGAFLRTHFPKRHDKPLRLKASHAPARPNQAVAVSVVTPKLQQALPKPMALKAANFATASLPLEQRLLKALKSLNRGESFEPQVTIVSLQLMAGLLRGDPEQLALAYRSIGELLDGQEDGGATLRGSVIGLVDEKRLSKAVRKQQGYGDVRMHRQDAIFLTGLQFANEQLAKDPSPVGSLQDLYTARLIEEVYRSALLERPMIIDQAAWEGLPKSSSPEAGALFAAVKSLFPQLNAMAKAEQLPPLQFLVETPDAALSTTAKPRRGSAKVALLNESPAFEQAFSAIQNRAPETTGPHRPTDRNAHFSTDLDVVEVPPLPPQAAPKKAAPPDRLHLIVQLKSDPALERAAQGLFNSDVDRAVWIDMSGEQLRPVLNAPLLRTVGPQTKLDMHLVGPLPKDPSWPENPEIDVMYLAIDLARALHELGVDRPMESITLYHPPFNPLDPKSGPALLHSEARSMGVLGSTGGIIVNDSSAPTLPPQATAVQTTESSHTTRPWTAYAAQYPRLVFHRSHEGQLQVLADRLAKVHSTPTALGAQAKQVMSEAMRGSLHATLLKVGMKAIEPSRLETIADQIATGLIDHRWRSFSDAYRSLRELVQALPQPLLVTMAARPAGLLAKEHDQPGSQQASFSRSLAMTEGAYVLALDAGMAALTQWHESSTARPVDPSLALSGEPGVDPARIGLIQAALVSLFFDESFIVDARRLLRLAASGAARDQAMVDTTRRLSLAMGIPGHYGLMLKPTISVPQGMPETDELRAKARQLLAPTDADDAAELTYWPSFDDRKPMIGVARIAPQVRQTLDRAAGVITLEWDQAGFATPRRTRLKFAPLMDASDEEAVLAQDGEIVWLDRFITSYFFRVKDLKQTSLPPEITLDGDRLRVGRLRVAQRTGEGWRVDLGRLREVGEVIAIPPATHALPLSEWSKLSAPAAAHPQEPPPRIRIVVQMSENLNGDPHYNNHPTESILIRADRFGQHEIAWGRPLVRHLAAVNDIKWVILGHGSHVGSDFEPEMAGYSPEALADRLQSIAQDLKLPVPIKRLSLLACHLETPVLQNKFTEAFIRHGVTTGALAAGVQVSTATQSIVTFKAGGKRRRYSEAYSEAPNEYHPPGTHYRFTHDPLTDHIYATDKYPFGGDKTVMFKRNPSTGKITTKNHLLSSTTPVDPALSQAMHAIEARALAPQTLGLAEAARMDPGEAWQALSDSRIIATTASPTAEPAPRPVSAAAAPPIQVDPKRLLETLEAGDEDRVALSGQLLALPDDQFKAFTEATTTALDAANLPAEHAQSLRSWLDHARAVRQRLSTMTKAAANALGSTLESGANVAMGVLGVYQVAAGWSSMDTTQRGLAFTQAGGFVISPLAAAAGRLLSSVSAGARVLGLAGDLLQGGVIDVPLAAVSLALIGEQWKAFHASGQGTDSLAYRSLVANTAITVVTTAVSLGMAGAQITAMLSSASAAEAFAGLAAAAGGVALPFAVLVMGVTGAVNTLLWADEYAGYLRGSDWEVARTALALFFGVKTDAALRAEVDAQAEAAACRRQKLLTEQAAQHRTFLSDSYARMGFATLKTTTQQYGVRHATFRNDQVDPPFSAVLQDASKPDALIDVQARPEALPAGAHGGLAWVQVDDRDLTAANDGETPSQPQLFDLSGNRAARIRGGQGNDLFVLNAGSAIGELDGAGGLDQVQLDAQQQGVRYRPLRGSGANGAAQLSFGPIEADAPGAVDKRTKGPHKTVLRGVRQLRVTNAATARINGGPADEYFDISGSDVQINGAGGRNTFQVRPGNQIATVSNDLLLWNGDTAATVVVRGNAQMPLLLQVAVPFEDLDIAREDQDLLISTGSGQPLRFQDYYDTRTADAKSIALRPLLIRDVSGLLVRPSLQHPLTATPVPLTAMSSTVQYDADTPQTRRQLATRHGQVLHRLARGSGVFHVRASAGLPAHVDLDLPWSKLRFDFHGDDLVVSEQAPKGADALLLVVSGYRRQAVGQPGVVLLARPAQGDQSGNAAVDARLQPAPAPVLLRLPAPNAAVAGPVQVHGTSLPAVSGTNLPFAVGPTLNASLNSTLDSTVNSTLNSTLSPASEAARTGTPGDDQLASDGLPPNAVLAGGDGSDRYRVRAGDRVRIDNASLDQRLDTLEFSARADEIVMAVRGDDLLLSTRTPSGPATRVLGYQSDASLRHLQLEVAGGARYLLPIADRVTGAFVHDLSRSWDDVLIASPGLHVLRVLKAHQMQVPSPASERPVRQVFLPAPLQDYEVHKDGLDAQLSYGFGEFRTVIRLIDYYAHADGLRFQWRDPDSAALQTFDGLLLPPALAQEAADAGVHAPSLGWLQAHAVSDDPDLPQRFRDHFDSTQPRDASPVDASLVTLYLRAKGLPEDDTTPWPALTATEVRRLLRLREVAGVEVPRELLLSYARSNYGPTTLTAYQHRALIQHLLKADHGAPFFTVALYSHLTLPQMRAFERWAAQTRPGESLSEWAPRALSKFSRWMVSKPGRRERLEPEDASLMVAYLEYQGRAPADARELAAVMVEAGTADVAYVEAMRDLGITRGARIGKLKRAGVQARDVLMGNLSRTDYEGLKDRSGKVTVTTSEALQNRGTLPQHRYWLDQYLALDKDGNQLIALGSEPADGTAYDLAPGPLLDVTGASPDLYVTHDGKGQPLPQSPANLQRHGLAQLVRQQLVQHADVPPRTEPQWFGLSHPAHLVDGSVADGEALAWLPAFSQKEGGGWQPLDVATDRLAALQFTLAEPILLTQIDLHVQLQAPATATLRQDGLSWRVEASANGNTWTHVGLAEWRPLQLPAGEQPVPVVHRMPIDTAGLPYRHYRLVATGGQFRPNEWIKEAVFHTAPVTDEVPVSVSAARKPRSAGLPTVDPVTVDPVTVTPVTVAPVTWEQATLETKPHAGSMSTAHLSLEQAMAGFDASPTGAVLGFAPQRPPVPGAQALLMATP